MKLVFVGGEDVSARIEIAKKFIQLGYEVEIVGTEKEDKFIREGIPYKKYFFNRELNVFDDIKTIFGLRKILKNYKGSIVHAFDTKPTLFLPIASIGLNITVIRTITGMGRIFTENTFKYRLLRFIYNLIQKILSKKVDFTIFQNEDDYNYFVENSLIKHEKGKIIKSSGINLEKFNASNVDLDKVSELKKELKLNSDTKTFLLVSRIVKQKGILNYLEAAKICYDKGYKYNFLLVGQLDTDSSISKEQIDKYKEYVFYLGKRSDVKELMYISDIFVLPTYYREGVPRVLLEASAMGLPIITTNMPGCKDVVENNFNGLLVNIKDSKDLAEKMIFLADNERLYKKLSKNALEKVKEFNLNKIVKEYDNIYKHLKGISYES